MPDTKVIKTPEDALASVRSIQRVMGDPIESAQIALDGLAPRIVRGLALLRLTEEAKAAQREETLRIEREAADERARRIEERQNSPEGQAKQAAMRAHWAAEDERLLREHKERMQAIYRDMEQTIERRARELHIEWTRELLDAPIALPDGTRTTWGALTVEQHRARIKMLTGNAAGNVEAAARHVAAVYHLQSTCATTLNDTITERLV